MQLNFVDKPLARYIGKCKCKRAFSVVARMQSYDINAFVPDYEARKVNGNWAPLDVVFERADGNLMVGSSKLRFAPVVECDCGSDTLGRNPLVALSPVAFSMKVGHVCNHSCTHSKGDVCICSCGGLNHGAHFNLN